MAYFFFLRNKSEFQTLEKPQKSDMVGEMSLLYTLVTYHDVTIPSILPHWALAVLSTSFAQLNCGQF